MASVHCFNGLNKQNALTALLSRITSLSNRPRGQTLDVNSGVAQKNKNERYDHVIFLTEALQSRFNENSLKEIRIKGL